jgi:hypothetical protein
MNANAQSHRLLHRPPMIGGSLRNLRLLGPCLIYIGLLYLQSVMWFFFPRYVAEALNTFVLALAAVSLLFGFGLSSFLRPHGAAFSAVILISLILATGLNSEWSAVGFQLVLYRAASSVLVFFVFAAAARVDNGLRLICGTLAFCALINVLVAIWGAVTQQSLFGVTSAEVGVGTFGFDAESGRSGGLMGENYCGIYNLPAIAASVCIFEFSKRHVIALTLVFITLTGTIVSLSRGSILAAVVGTLFVFAFSRKRLTLRSAFLVPLVLFLLASLGYALYETALDQLPTDIRGSMESRFSKQGLAEDSRNDILGVYLDQLLRNIVLGAGPGYIQWNVEVGMPVPHNSILDVAVELGLVGTIFFGSLLYRPFLVLSICRRNALLCVIGASFVGTLASMMFLSNPFLRIAWLLAGILTGRSLIPANRVDHYK